MNEFTKAQLQDLHESTRYSIVHDIIEQDSIKEPQRLRRINIFLTIYQTLKKGIKAEQLNLGVESHEAREKLNHLLELQLINYQITIEQIDEFLEQNHL